MLFPYLFATFLAIAALAVAETSSATAARTASLSAIGIGVTNMTESTKFYTEMFGMKYTGQLIRTPLFDEMILTYPTPSTGSALVLMEWKNKKSVKDLPIKLVFYVEDVKQNIEKLRKAGMKITLEPGTGKIGNTTLPTAFASDPDGYVLEVNPISMLGRSLGS
jgi:lactoylglutathione lyase